MSNKEIKKLLSCNSCRISYACEGCEITWTDKKKIKEYIDQLENKVKELGKGQHTLMQSRRKWKNKYYKERRKRKEADKSVWQIYLDYQDIGNMYFNLDSKVQSLVEKLKEQSSRKISNEEDKEYTEGYRDLVRDLLEMLEVAND